MQSLDELMKLSGAIASFEFSDRGELTDHRLAEGNELTPDILDLVSHVCVANISIATMQARGWEKVTGQAGFYPIEGFTLVGFDWSTVSNGNRGVILRNEEADYQAAYDALGV
jgi:roadblock/LC7 domain-containing protein